MHLLSLLFAVLLVIPHNLIAAQKSAARPNILWITCEDMSPNLGCYGDSYAHTPNLDAFARQSVRYTHAFATAPACSPSRSALITGMYATSLNTQHLRSHFPIPAEFKAFPSYLRAAGFYCSNNKKTDYNVANEPAMIRSAWDESSGKAHWRNRAKGQPFFSVFNFMETHQSRTSMGGAPVEKMLKAVLTPAERHDPAKAPVPPFYPDTPLVRQTLARYYDAISAMDKEVGRVLKELDEDGLADDTIVFFFSDHGMGMPRGKRTLYDSGMRVPLLVRFPEKYKHLAPAPAGKTESRLVSFVDFAPTMLSLLEMKIPKHMQGTPFLGKSAGKPHRFIFGARDRVDEAFDVARSVRDARYLYIRNYVPHRSWNQPEGSSDRSEMRREITRLAREGKLNAAQFTYAGPTRPIEELFDTETDPHQLHNLAGDPKHRTLLEKMRQKANEWSLETRNVGFLTEHEVSSRLQNDTPFEMARDSSRYPLKRILAAADLVGRANSTKEHRVLLNDADSAVRYWSIIAMRAAGSRDDSARAQLKHALNDVSPSVRIEAAAALVEMDASEPSLDALIKELKNKSPDVVLHATRTLELLGEKARPALPAMKRALEECSDPEYRLYLEFSVTAATQNLKEAKR